MIFKVIGVSNFGKTARVDVETQENLRPYFYDLTTESPSANEWNDVVARAIAQATGQAPVATPAPVAKVEEKVAAPAVQAPVAQAAQPVAAPAAKAETVAAPKFSKEDKEHAKKAGEIWAKLHGISKISPKDSPAELATLREVTARITSTIDYVDLEKVLTEEHAKLKAAAAPTQECWVKGDAAKVKLLDEVVVGALGGMPTKDQLKELAKVTTEWVETKAIVIIGGQLTDAAKAQLISVVKPAAEEEVCL